jgi:hypothetical protein
MDQTTLKYYNLCIIMQLDILLFVILCVVVLFMCNHIPTPLAVSVRAPLQPDADMSQWILDHTYIKKGVLDENNFKGTRGCLCIFRDRDVGTVFKDPLLAPLLPHFQQLREAGEDHGNAKGSNAYVMNILINYNSGNGVGWHADDTIEFALPDSDDVEHDRMATAVSVLYIATGGHKSCGGVFKIKDDRGQRMNLVPSVGDIVVFPGKFDHKVTPLSRGMAPRVSLVVESYSLSDANYKALEIQVPKKRKRKTKD